MTLKKSKEEMKSKKVVMFMWRKLILLRGGKNLIRNSLRCSGLFNISLSFLPLALTTTTT